MWHRSGDSAERRTLKANYSAALFRNAATVKFKAVPGNWSGFLAFGLSFSQCRFRGMKTGRNDPCPCGSGKKYKRCCLTKDDEQRVAARDDAVFPDDAAVPSPDIHLIAGQLRALSKQSSGKARAELDRLLAETGPILDYMERQPEIEAASKAIEAHRADFLQLVEDEKKYLKRVRSLFAENRFDPLRFTAGDVRRAFDEVGQPPNLAPDERFVKCVLAAILFLAGKERRNELAMRLLMHLPDFVAAGRPLDAWIIQHCAYLTTDSPDESNPFLFEMFSHGYDAWAGEQRECDAALLQELGLDVDHLQDMSLDEIDSWLQEQQADPARKARMEALFQTHPDQRDQATSSLEEMERDSISLLERPDAGVLLLTPEEIGPWLAILNERLESQRDQLPDLADPSPDPAAVKAMGDLMWLMLREMAAKIFTPERIGHLIAQLKTYRNERFAAGEKRIAGCTLGAITSIGRETDSAHNYFLNAVCFASLRMAMRDPGLRTEELPSLEKSPE